MNVIKLVDTIHKLTGVVVSECDHFAGIKEFGGKKGFNVLFNDRLSESKDYNLVLSMCEKSNLFKIHQNGLKRCLITF